MTILIQCSHPTAAHDPTLSQWHPWIIMDVSMLDCFCPVLETGLGKLLGLEFPSTTLILFITTKSTLLDQLAGEENIDPAVTARIRAIFASQRATLQETQPNSAPFADMGALTSSDDDD